MSILQREDPCILWIQVHKATVCRICLIDGYFPGNHAEIEKWRREQAKIRSRKR